MAPADSPPAEPWLRRQCFELGRSRGGAVGWLAWAAFSFLLVWGSPKSKGRRLAAVKAWATAQVARRRGRWIKVSMGAAVMEVPPVSAIGPLLAACGTHEAVEDALATALTGPGDSVVDAGAHIGSFGLLLDRRRVTFIEAHPDTADVLRRNLHASTQIEGKVLQVAVGAQPGQVSFTVDRDVQNQIVTEATDTSVAVEMVTIDSVCEAWPALALLKLDLEGFDLDGLRGASATLARLRPFVFVETKFGGWEIRSWLLEANYGTFWYDWRHRRLADLHPEWKGNHDFHTNLVAVPIERVEEARRLVAEFDPRRHWESFSPRLTVL